MKIGRIIETKFVRPDEVLPTDEILDSVAADEFAAKQEKWLKGLQDSMRSAERTIAIRREVL